MDKSTKDYVTLVRVQELKEILKYLNLPMSGPKEQLQARIYAYFGEKHPNATLITNIIAASNSSQRKAAARKIKEICQPYIRCRRTPRLSDAEGLPQEKSQAGTSVLTRAEIISPGTGTAVNQPVYVIDKAGVKAAAPAPASPVIRCICSSKSTAAALLQCQASNCGIHAHLTCVNSKGSPTEPFYCELCRAAWADPFWEVRYPRILAPQKLQRNGVPATGMEIPKLIEKTFPISASQLQLVQEPASEYHLQAVCLLLNDGVPFRFLWPKNADLRVNGISFRVYPRPPASKVGNNIRDEPASLASALFTGQNRIRLQGFDNRDFVLMVRLVKKRGLEDVKKLMAPPEAIDEALQRMKKAIGGGETVDDDLAVGTSTISLRDPMSGARVATPARFTGNLGLVAFDLDTFLRMVQQTRKWQCPHSMRHARVQDLQIDQYLTEILQRLKGLPDVMEIEVAPDGHWRPANDLYPWIKIADPMPLPLSPIKSAVDLEPNTPLEESEEELSEEEELRRNARAYASSTQACTQEVVVLDSSDEDTDGPLAKRARKGNNLLQTSTKQNSHDAQRAGLHSLTNPQEPGQPEGEAPITGSNPQLVSQQGGSKSGIVISLPRRPRAPVSSSQSHRASPAKVPRSVPSSLPTSSGLENPTGTNGARASGEARHPATGKKQHRQIRETIIDLDDYADSD